MTTEEQSIKPTLGEQITELYGRVAKLNDIAAALLNPNWGANVGIIPEGHLLYPDAVEPLREQLAARDAALAACTAQLVHDQATLARVRAAADQIHRAVLNANGEPLTAYDQGVDTAVRRILAALQPPASDGGPTVAEAAADDRRWFDVEKEGK